MSVRTALLTVSLTVAAAGAAAAGKPPDLPADPLTEGKEPTPVEREFYLPTSVARRSVAGPDTERSGPLVPVARVDWRAVGSFWATRLGLALPWVEWY